VSAGERVRDAVRATLRPYDLDAGLQIDWRYLSDVERAAWDAVAAAIVIEDAG
jgi:hypothetical protein